MAFNPKDHYFKKAKKEGYSARSVFKLEEIHQKNKIFSAGDCVLDLGASPGSWSQYAGKLVGPKGQVISIDLNPAKGLNQDNVTFIQMDIFEIDVEQLIPKGGSTPIKKFNVVMSDMAPKTPGIKHVDQARSLNLCEKAFEVAKEHLSTHGNFVVKIFEGPDTKAFCDSLKAYFKTTKLLRPKGTRSTSKEIFLIGLNFQNN